MGSSCFVLILIWLTGSLLREEVGTGIYLANLFISGLNIHLMPVIFFIFSGVLSVLMGSAWGSMSVSIPIALPMLSIMLTGGQGNLILAESLILLPLLGGIVAGSLIGNHLSPLSDTMFMSATSSGAVHSDLIVAQAEHLFPCIGAAMVSFLCAGFTVQLIGYWLSAFLSLGLGAAVITLFLIFRLKKS